MKYYNPKEKIYQNTSVKENVFNVCKNRYEEINCFQRDDITQHLTSIEIEETVTSGGYVVDILEGFICDDLDYNPFERLIIDFTAKVINFEKENKTLLQSLTKKCFFSVYRGCIRKDIEESYNCVTQRWMKSEYDESVREWFPLNNGKNMVTIKDRDDEGISKKN